MTFSKPYFATRLEANFEIKTVLKVMGNLFFPKYLWLFTFPQLWIKQWLMVVGSLEDLPVDMATRIYCTVFHMKS